MRTTVDENRSIARWIATKLNQATTPVTILLPEKGVSMLDAEGQAFFDPDADAALFEELELQLADNVLCEVRRLPFHINDAEFSDALVEAFVSAVQQPE